MIFFLFFPNLILFCVVFKVIRLKTTTVAVSVKLKRKSDEIAPRKSLDKFRS